MNARVSGRQVIAAFGGPVVWFAHFGLMYAVNAVQCARGQDATIMGVRPIALTAALATAAAVVLIVSFWRFGAEAPPEGPEGSTPDMLAFLARWLGALSLVAIILTVIPVFVFRSC